MRAALARSASVVVTAAALLGGLALVALIVCLVVGARPVVLTSGSMSPSMPAGAVALTVPVSGAQVELGQVLTVPAQAGGLVTHRVVDVTASGARVLAELRGDANPVPDAAPYDVTDGARRVVASVPWGGRLVEAARGPWLVAGALALVVLALLPARERGRAGPRRDEVERARTDGGGAAR